MMWLKCSVTGPYLHWEFLYLLYSCGNDSWNHCHVPNSAPIIQRWNQQSPCSLDWRNTYSYANSVVCYACSWFSPPISAGWILIRYNYTHNRMCHNEYLIKLMEFLINSILFKGAITKRMTAIEEMAGMDVLCSDKTGTLTLNRLTVDRNLIEVQNLIYYVYNWI